MQTRVPQRVIRAAGALLAVAVIVTAWRTVNPPTAFRAVSRVEIAEGAVTTVAGELEALRRQVAGTLVVVARADGADAVEVSFQARDPVEAVRTVNDVVDTYLHTRPSARALRVATLRAELRAEIDRQTALLRRVEEDRAAAQALLARTRRDRELSEAKVASLEASLARARDRVAQLAPVAAHLRSGRPAESLGMVGGMPFISAFQERLAVLDGERVALLARYGPAHPDVARKTDERQAVADQLHAELSALASTLLQDYDTALQEQVLLERERDGALTRSDVPVPSNSEYRSLSRRASEARVTLTAMEERERQLTALSREPMMDLGHVDRAALVRPMVPAPARWPWGLAILAAIAASLAAPAALRALVRRTTADAG